MWKKGWRWRAGLGTLERENEKKLICGLVVAISSVCCVLSVRPRDEQEEADEYDRDSTKRGTVSTIGRVGAGVCGPLCESQQRTVAQATAEDRESTPAVDPQAPVGAGRSGDVGDSASGDGEPGGGALGYEDGG
jgi:hypothetical protein